MSFHYRYRKQIIIIAIAVLMVATLITTTIYFYPPKKEQKISSLKIEKATTQTKQESTSEKEEIKYMVDIKGEVVAPGTYELKNTSRVIDVIKIAGGLTENADTTVINLSKRIEDEW